jgi:PAS domain-containing protein
MVSDSPPLVERPHGGTRDPRLVDRPVPWGSRADGVADGPAPTFSRVAAAHRLDAAVLDEVLARLSVGVLVTDQDGRVVYANATARDLGLTDGAALGWTVMRALLTADAVHDEEIELLTPGRARRRLSVDVVPARGAGGAHAAMLTAVDVTARKQAAEWAPVIESLMNL